MKGYFQLFWLPEKRLMGFVEILENWKKHNENRWKVEKEINILMKKVCLNWNKESGWMRRWGEWVIIQLDMPNWYWCDLSVILLTKKSKFEMDSLFVNQFQLTSQSHNINSLKRHHVNQQKHDFLRKVISFYFHIY